MKLPKIAFAVIAAASLSGGANAATTKYYSRAHLPFSTAQAATPDPTPAITYTATAWNAPSSCTKNSQTATVKTCKSSDGSTVAVSNCAGQDQTTYCGFNCSDLSQNNTPVKTDGWSQLGTGITSAAQAKAICSSVLYNERGYRTNGLCYWNSTNGEVREYNYGSITTTTSGNLWASSCFAS